MRTATYVYAVREAASAPPEAAGHPGGGAVRLLAFGGLAAVVQDVPAEEFSEEAMRERLAERAQLERCARTHHEVVTAAAATGPVVPLPLATLYGDDARTREALAEHEERFAGALRRIAGHVEWAVKVHRDGAAPEHHVPEPAAEEAPPAGGLDYLRQVRRRREERERKQALSLDVADAVDRALRGVAVASVRRRPHGVEVTGRERPQVMNAAYLVPRGDEPELAAVLAELRADPALAGFSLESSGPWVPYSFTGEPALEESR